MRKGISRTISGLTLATRKIFSKNLTRFALSATEKAAITLVFSVAPSIFCASMSVDLMGRPVGVSHGRSYCLVGPCSAETTLASKSRLCTRKSEIEFLKWNKELVS